MIKGHGGNIYALSRQLGCRPSDIVDMSSNVNPLGPPSDLFSFICDNLDVITSLPEVDAESAIKSFASFYNISSEKILAGSGTTEFIYTIPQVVEAKQALILGPTYADYADACTMHHVDYSFLHADERALFQHDLGHVKTKAKNADIVFICNPNNPTGTLILADDLKDMCQSCPETVFVIDESYLLFAKNGMNESLMTCGLSNVIVLNSMSKIFRIPGLRVGFMIAPEKIVETCRRYSRPWSMNSLAQVAVNHLLENPEKIEKFIIKTVTFIQTEKDFFYNEMQTISGIKLFHSNTSFVLIQLPEEMNSYVVCDKLAEQKILIRNCSNFEGLSDKYIRVSLKDRATNQLLVDKLLTVLREP